MEAFRSGKNFIKSRYTHISKQWISNSFQDEILYWREKSWATLSLSSKTLSKKQSAEEMWYPTTTNVVNRTVTAANHQRYTFSKCKFQRHKFLPSSATIGFYRFTTDSSTVVEVSITSPLSSRLWVITIFRVIGEFSKISCLTTMTLVPLRFLDFTRGWNTIHPRWIIPTFPIVRSSLSFRFLRTRGWTEILFLVLVTPSHFTELLPLFAV